MASPHDKSRPAAPAILQLGRLRIPLLVITISFVACLLTTLTAGLWPFSSPANDAAWLPGENGLRFNLHGTAVSENALLGADFGSCTLETRLQPAMIWNTGTALSFYDAHNGRQLLINQDYEDLLLQLAERDQEGSVVVRRLRVANVFREKDFLLTVGSDGRKTFIYVNGRLVEESSEFPLSSRDVSSQLILGNAPLRKHAWAGVVKGVAVYAGELNAQQALDHEQHFSQQQQTALVASGGLRALYLFDEHSGRIVHNAVPSGVNLEIPPKFITIDQLHFESPKSEAHADGHYTADIVVNILGFMPLGFVAAMFFVTLVDIKRAALLATIVGAATSLTIEYFQAFLPTRYSGVTDLFTNPSGALIGALLFVAVAKVAANKNGVERWLNPK